MVLAAGCGGGGEEPRLAQPRAEALASRAESAAGHLDRDEFCAAQEDAVVLQRQTIAAINEGAVPAELQEELLGSVNALAEAISCAPRGADAGAADDARDLAERLRDPWD